MSDYPEEEFEQVRTLVRRKAAKRYDWDPLRDAYRDWLERELKQRGIWQQTVDSSSLSRETESGMGLKALETRADRASRGRPEELPTYIAALDPMANEIRSQMASGGQSGPRWQEPLPSTVASASGTPSFPTPNPSPELS